MNLMSHISKVQFPRGNSKGSINNITYKEDILKSLYDKLNKKNNTLFQSAKKFNVESHIENNFCVI